MFEKKITLPLTVMLPRKTKADKKAIINLNNYPHWHYITYNQIKKAYKEILEDQLKGLKLKGQVVLFYKLFKGSNRRSDRANVLSVHDKFFCDALTEYECIPDDNDDIIISQHFVQTEVDIKNPRVEVKIVCDQYAQD